MIDKPSGLPTLPCSGLLENSVLRLYSDMSTMQILSTDWAEPPRLSVSSPRNHRPPPVSGKLEHAQIQKIYRAVAESVAERDKCEIHTPIALVPHPR